MKKLHIQHPNKLHSLIRSNYFEEPRKSGQGNIFDKSKTKIGKQSIQYRLEHLRLINWNNANLSNDIPFEYY